MFDLDSIIDFIGKLLGSGAADAAASAAEAADAVASAADAADVIAGAADAADAAGAVADTADAMDAATAAAATVDPGVDATGMEDGGDVSDGAVDGGPIADPSMGDLGIAGTPVISGDAEVDDVLNNGITPDKGGITFGSAVGCNVCGCKCFVPASGDRTYSLCICGHPKYKHVWVS